MHKRVVGLGVVLLVAAGLLASCGDDGDRLSKAEFTSRGDTVCRTLDANVKKVGAEFPEVVDFTPQMMQSLWQKLLTQVDKAVADLKKLKPPEDLQGGFDAAIDQAQKDRVKLIDASETPEAAEKLFAARKDPFTATNDKLAAVGITACKEGSAPEGSTEAGAGGTGATTSSTNP